MLSQLRPAPRVMYPASPGTVPWGSDGSGWVSPGLCVACPRRPWHRSHAAFAASGVALARSPPGCLRVPCAPRHSVLRATSRQLRAGGGLASVARRSPVQQQGCYCRKISCGFAPGSVAPEVLPCKVGAQRRASELKRQMGWEESTMLPGITPNLPGEKKRTVTSGKMARSMKTSICHLSATG